MSRLANEQFHHSATPTRPPEHCGCHAPDPQQVFTLSNGSKIRFETSFGNLFNRTLFGEPANNWRKRRGRAGW